MAGVYGNIGVIVASKTKDLSDRICEEFKAICPKHIVPDKVPAKGDQPKAPDLHLLNEDILIEFKSINIELEDTNSNGEKINRAKRQNSVLFGTGHISFSDKEFVRFSQKMTGRLRNSIEDADKQLSIYCDDRDLLTVCCVVVEFAEQRVFDWFQKNLPTRDMVRVSVSKEFKKRDIDVVLTFMIGHDGAVSMDAIQRVYKDGYLEPQCRRLMVLLSHVFNRLGLKLDHSETPIQFFEPTT